MAPVLDIGCGDGLFARILFKDKIDVGIDPQAIEIAHAQKQNGYAKLVQCYGNEMPFADKSFNTILSNSVMEHIQDIEPVLKEARRVLADDGCMYLTLPTNKFDQYSVVYQFLKTLHLDQVAEKYSRFFNSFWRHYHYYTVSGWEDLFKKTGFVVEENQEYLPKTSAVLNDFFSPFSIFSFLQKKFFNTWFLFPGLRRPLASLYFRIYKGTPFNLKPQQGSGGLVFFKLRKV
jgi:ubiquinone/menaquinone biosynthesis C-methylase UbiE